MKEDTERVCDNCRFWQPTNDGVGQCRRRAPSRIHADCIEPSERSSEGDDAFRLWPLTAPEDWCGEFEPDTKFRPVVE
jgi:hypothetical protein